MESTGANGKLTQNKDCSVPDVIWVDDWFEAKYEEACIQHDIYYTEGSTVSRLEADNIFLSDMLTIGGIFIPALAYLAVRIFGFTRFGKK